MSAVAKTITPSVCTPLPVDSDRLPPLTAGEDLAAGDACYIKSDGLVYKSVDTAVATPAAPAVAKADTGGTVLTGTYQVGVTYLTAAGLESALSALTPITTAADVSTITVTSPAASTGATKYRVYVSAPNGQTLYLQNGAGTNLATDLTITAPPVTNTAQPPAGNGSTVGAAAAVDGFAPIAVSSGRPVTLYDGVNMSYGPTSLTPGARLYLSGSVAGGLDTAAARSTSQAIAKVVSIDTTQGHARLRVFSTRY